MISKVIWSVLIVFTFYSCERSGSKGSNLTLTERVKPDSIRIALGDNTIQVYSKLIKEDPVLFVNLHEDENTSVEALYRTYLKKPISFMHLVHTGERRIWFEHHDTAHSIDPNRIFTPLGREKTLRDSLNYSQSGMFYSSLLADTLLNFMAGKEWVIAVHNNTNENYSIRSYLEGGDEAANASKVYYNPSADEDDFVYTTDEALYEFLEAKGVNVILQDNSDNIDDGSLSIYCGARGIRYANVETEHGHLSKQLQLLDLIIAFLSGRTGCSA